MQYYYKDFCTVRFDHKDLGTVQYYYKDFFVQCSIITKIFLYSAVWVKRFFNNAVWSHAKICVQCGKSRNIFNSMSTKSHRYLCEALCSCFWSHTIETWPLQALTEIIFIAFYYLVLEEKNPMKIKNSEKFWQISMRNERL